MSRKKTIFSQLSRHKLFAANLMTSSAEFSLYPYSSIKVFTISLYFPCCFLSLDLDFVTIREICLTEEVNLLSIASLSGAYYCQSTFSPLRNLENMKAVISTLKFSLEVPVIPICSSIEAINFSSGCISSFVTRSFTVDMLT